MSKGAADGSVSQPHHIGGKENGAQDNAEVIDNGGQGGQQEMLPGIEGAYNDPTGAKNDRRQQHHPH